MAVPVHLPGKRFQIQQAEKDIPGSCPYANNLLCIRIDSQRRIHSGISVENGKGIPSCQQVASLQPVGTPGVTYVHLSGQSSTPGAAVRANQKHGPEVMFQTPAMGSGKQRAQ